jgi:protein gp37
MECIFAYVKQVPKHTYLFLTKRPWELRKYEWPENCWVGTTIDGTEFNTHQFETLRYMADVQAIVKFISFEPLVGRLCIGYDRSWWAEQFAKIGINWLILGGRTGRKKFHPPEEWIREIEDAADAAGIPVFEKPNLRAEGPFRQEFPASREVTATP